MIIQLSHNGLQMSMSPNGQYNKIKYHFNSRTNGVRYWNNEKDHMRKFIKQHGWYLENINNETFNPIPKEDDLFFWGEWEPQSKFELTGYRLKDNRLPHAIHEPFFSNKGFGSHNTDPFVFGENFYWSNCKQKEKGKGARILNIPNGSIILWGSEIEREYFVLDTMFVTQSKETIADYKTHPTLYPDLLRKVTLDFKGGLSNWYWLYKGKMYDMDNYYSENNNYTFCFFPCMVGNNGKAGFERPILDIQKFNLQNPGAGMVTRVVDNTENNNSNYWHNIVAEIISQGYSLGIKLDLPYTLDEIELPEYKIIGKGC